jgi:hypothetical protein
MKHFDLGKNLHKYKQEWLKAFEDHDLPKQKAIFAKIFPDNSKPIDSFNEFDPFNPFFIPYGPNPLSEIAAWSNWSAKMSSSIDYSFFSSFSTYSVYSTKLPGPSKDSWQSPETKRALQVDNEIARDEARLPDWIPRNRRRIAELLWMAGEAFQRTVVARTVANGMAVKL